MTLSESRVLVTAPIGRDAELICATLGAQNIKCEQCASIREACEKAETGAGAMLLAEEAFMPGALEHLTALLEAQPRWSSLHVILLTSNSDRIQRAGKTLLRQRYATGDLTLLERPARRVALLTAVESALHARWRQYELRDHLALLSRQEERLRQSQKMESIGILAGGIAHDFNNLLTGILGNASLLEEKVAPPDNQMVADIALAATKAADLTRQMLAYSGKGRFVIQDVNLSTLIVETLRLVKAAIDKSVNVLLALDGRLPSVRADPGQMQQLVMNLIINAAEAIGKKEGTLSISTCVQEVSDGFPSQTFQREELKPGRYVQLEVRDTGSGMSEETLAKIFDPFFTTKFTGRGLGLAAVSGILRGHAGGLQVESESGRGTAFRVYIPVMLTDAQPVSSNITTQTKSGWGKILLVDDEEGVRRIGRTMLQQQGYEVLLAENGREALAIVQEHRTSIRLIILDLTMPVMPGEEALALLKRIVPEIPVLLCSAHIKGELIERLGRESFAGFLQKPFTYSQFAKATSEILKDTVPR